MIYLMPVKLPKGAYYETTRHGKRVIYYREDKGPRIRLPDDPRSDEFKIAYQAALLGEALPTAQSTAPSNSLRWLIDRYQMSETWLALKPATQNQRTYIFDAMVRKSKNPKYDRITTARIEAGMRTRTNTPAQANNFLKAMRGLFKWAVDEKHIARDPSAGVERLKLRASEGFPAWDIEDVAAFRKCHEIGTKARLAMELYLFTGLRRGDMMRAGRQHMRGNIFSIKTEKTGAWVTVEFPPYLMELLDCTATGDLHFIVGERGNPFTKESIGTWFGKHCRKAGLTKSAHGLRKLSATLAAEGGAASKQLMAQYGWSNFKQAETYTQTADRKRMGVDASRIVAGQIENTFPRTSNPVRDMEKKEQ